MVEQVHALLLSKLLPMAEGALLSFISRTTGKSSFKRFHYLCRLDNSTYFAF